MKKNRRRMSLRALTALTIAAVTVAAALTAVAAACVLRGRETPATPARTTIALPEAPVEQPAAERPASDAFEYLPVYTHGDTDEKVIAITVDDCYQPNNLKTIAETAARAGGQLTIFPIGENLSRPGMPELLRHMAFDLGFEIENHTWSHQRVFRLSEDEMAREIWDQREAVNRALGVNYQQHFFRLMGGDGEYDQRTHNYLEQLGYRGIAHWSLSGSDADMDLIQKRLKPGAIYLFHTTDGDTKKLKEFIPYAAAQGYRLVTLNALLGLEPNAVSAYAPEEMPRPRAYADDLRTQRKGDYAWCVVGMQDALRRMGYLRLEGASTGYYGVQTAEAVKRFQMAHGLETTGEADRATREALARN